jgi:WD40 repeat protein
MKKYILLTGILILLLLTGCSTTPQPTTTTPSTTPEETVIPQLDPPVGVNVGQTFNLSWSPDGSQLAVMTGNGIIRFSAQDWQPINRIDLPELSTFTKFYFDSQTIIGRHYKDSAFLKIDIKTEKTISKTTFSLGEDEYIIDYSEKGEFVIKKGYSCTSSPCQEKYTLLSTKDDSLSFPLFDYTPELSNASVVFKFNPDQSLLAEGADDNIIRVWNLEKKELLFSAIHDSNINDLDFSSDNQLLVSASDDGSAKIWDIDSGKETGKIDHLVDRAAIARFNQDNSQIILGLQNGTFSLWTIKGQGLEPEKIKNLFTIKLSWGFSPVISISPDQKQIAILNAGHVDIWNAETGDYLSTLPLINGHVNTITNSQDGKYLAITDESHLYLYETNPMKYKGVMPGPESEIDLVSFIGDSGQIAAVRYSTMTMWDIGTGEVRSILGEDSDPCRGVINFFSGDGTLYESTSGMGHFICSLKTGKPISTLVAPDGSFAPLGFNEDHSRVYGSDAKNSYLLDTNTGKVVFKFDNRFDKIICRGNILATWQFSDPTIHLFSVQSGEKMSDIIASGSIGSVAINQMENLLAVTAGNKVEVFDINHGHLLQSLDYETYYTLSFGVSADKLYLLNSYGKMDNWDLTVFSDPEKFLLSDPADTAAYPCAPFNNEGELIQTPTPAVLNMVTPSPTMLPELTPEVETINPVKSTQIVVDEPVPNFTRWSDDGSQLAVVSKYSIDIYEVGSTIPLHRLPHNSFIETVAFSESKTMLAIQISNDHVELWDLETGKVLREFQDMGCWNRNMRFSENDHFLTVDCFGSGYRWDIQGSLAGQPDSQSEGQYQKPEETKHIQYSGTGIRLLNDQQEIVKHIEYPYDSAEFYTYSPDHQLVIIGFAPYSLARSGVIITTSTTPAIGQVWDVSSLENPSLLTSLELGYWNLPGFFEYGYTSAQFTKDNQYLLTCFDDSQIIIWSVPSGKVVSTLPGKADFELSDDENQLLTLDAAGIVSVWDISNKFHPRPSWQLKTLGQDINELVVTDTNKELLVLNSAMVSSRQIRNSIISTDQKVNYFPGPSTTTYAASPNGRLIARNENGIVALLDRTKLEHSWETVYTPTEPPDRDYPLLIEFSPDSQKVAFLELENLIVIYDLSNRETVEISSESYITEIKFNRSGKWLLADNPSGKGILIDVTTGSVLREYNEIGAFHFFLPNQRDMIIITEDTGEVTRFNLGTRQKDVIINLTERIWTAVLSPDGNLLVISQETGTDFIDVETGTIIYHEKERFNSMVFSPDGTLLVTVSESNKIKAWAMK